MKEETREKLVKSYEGRKKSTIQRHEAELKSLKTRHERELKTLELQYEAMLKSDPEKLNQICNSIAGKDLHEINIATRKTIVIANC